MSSASPTAYVLFALIVVVAVFIGFRTNLFRGIGIAVLCSFMLPTWNTPAVLNTHLDYRVWASILAAAAAAVIHTRSTFDRLVTADIIVASLCVWQTFSEWHATENIIRPFILSYGFWILPYFVGRCCARSINDFSRLAFVSTAICCAFGTASLVESLSGIDIFEAVFGVRPGTQFHPRKLTRWGFSRCEGAYTHPIFFGTVMLMCLPWPIWLCLRRKGIQRGFAIAGTFLGGLAAFSSVSRAPILGLLIATFVATIVPFKKLVMISIAVGCVLFSTLIMKPDYLEASTLWFARMSGEHEDTIVIDKEKQVKTSSMSRLLILRHYGKSIRHAGIIGYGMTATDTFPPNVPFVPFDEVTQKQFGIVDNTYILLTLRGGWLMCLAFMLLHASAIYQFHTMTRQDPELVSFGRLMIGAICAHAFVVFTVYPDFDFMFVFLWTVGISSVRLQSDDKTNSGRAIRNQGSV